MIINFVVNPIAINGGWSPWDTRVGGSEECVIECSRRLAERGHTVSVYHNGLHGVYAGVRYLPHEEYLHRQSGVTVNVNFPDFLPLEPTLYWSSLVTQGGRDLSAFRVVCGISDYALRNTGLEHTNVETLPPGYDPGSVRRGDKIPQTVLYASSPDRGLDNLLKVWPDVVAVHPNAQLLVTYGGAGNTPNTLYLGEVTEEEMNQLYAESDIWCHPCNGGELYCMTGIKAQAAGCWPVYFPTMALAETVKFGTSTDREHLTKDLINALTGHPEAPVLKFPTWSSTTDQLEQLLIRYC